MISIGPDSLVFGMQLPVQAQSELFVADWERTAGPDEMAEVALAADRLGFFYLAACDHIAIPDELGPTMGTFWGDCVTTLAWIGALTTKVRLLSYVYVLAYRHPLAAAKAFATLDHLTNGRAIIGVGAGHVAGEFEALGTDVSSRGRLLDESLPVFAHALSQEHTSGVGQRPRPVQQPRPPIWVGGSSAAAMRRAATVGEGWLPQGPTTDAMVAFVREARAAAGRADEPIAIGHVTPFVYVGTPSWDVGAGTIAGPAAEVADRLTAGLVAGVNQIQVRLKARSCAELLEQMEAFAEHVAPLVRPVRS